MDARQSSKLQQSRPAGAYSLTPQQSVDLIVRTALEYGISDQRQIAYMLASAQHDSDQFRTAREYGGPRQAIVRGYGGGRNYFDRGYVQVTHDHRYAAMDRALELGGGVIANPDVVATDPHIGAQSLVVGMMRGLFTGKSLHSYVGGQQSDYVNARRTVNGTDKAALIAGYALSWEKKLPSIVTRLEQEGLERRPMPGNTTLADGKIGPGDRGYEVQQLQVRLGELGLRGASGKRITTDGVFSAETAHALKTFQARTGIGHDGVADAQTLRALGLEHLAPSRGLPQSVKSAASGFSPSDQRLQGKLDACVKALDHEAGKRWDESSGRVSAAAFLEAKRHGFSAQDDFRLVLSQRTETHREGDFVYLLRVGPSMYSDPAANRIRIAMNDALSNPSLPEMALSGVENGPQTQAVQASIQLNQTGALKR